MTETTSGAVWTPTPEEIQATNIHELMERHGFATYDDVHKWSVEHPEEFWAETIDKLGVPFKKPYEQMLDVSHGAKEATWLNGAEMNIADSCFAVGHEDKVAIITKRQNGETQKITQRELNEQSNQVANALVNMGLNKGDHIAINMSMTAEAVAFYLGIIKMGGVAVSIPDSFGEADIAKRLDISKAKAILTQDVFRKNGKSITMYPRVAGARKILSENGVPAEDLPKMVVIGSEASGIALEKDDTYWNDFLKGTSTKFESVSCSPQDQMNILFSSGTTGEPKAIAWNHTTPIKNASDALWHHDAKEGEVMCWPTNMGWMMGPWIVFASLMNKGTIALYEGTPTERGFCEFVQEAKVNMLGVVPSIVSAWRKGRYAEGLDWSAVRRFSSSGEASNGADYSWLMGLNQPDGSLRPVIEQIGGTELAGAYMANTMILPNEAAKFNAKAMGMDSVILNDKGEPCAPGEEGELFVKPPSIGMSTTASLLNANHNTIYYDRCPEGLRRHGDLIAIGKDGAWQSKGRADNTMNLNGIKVGSVEIENAVGKAGLTLETAAIGVPPASGGSDRLIIYAVPKSDFPMDDKTRKEMQLSMKLAMQKPLDQLNRSFKIKEVVLIEQLPRTASGKVMHKNLRADYQNREKAKAGEAASPGTTGLTQVTFGNLDLAKSPQFTFGLRA